MVSELPRETLSYSVERYWGSILKINVHATERVQYRQSIAEHGRVQLVNSHTVSFYVEVWAISFNGHSSSYSLSGGY